MCITIQIINRARICLNTLFVKNSFRLKRRAALENRFKILGEFILSSTSTTLLELINGCVDFSIGFFVISFKTCGRRACLVVVTKFLSGKWPFKYNWSKTALLLLATLRLQQFWMSFPVSTPFLRFSTLHIFKTGGSDIYFIKLKILRFCTTLFICKNLDLMFSLSIWKIAIFCKYIKPCSALHMLHKKTQKFWYQPYWSRQKKHDLNPSYLYPFWAYDMFEFLLHLSDI